MKKWKIAVVGAGYMATEHLKAFAALDDVEIAGLCGRQPARAKALAAQYGVEAYSTVDELYAKTRADACVVTVNELSMSLVCHQVFMHPWTCLLEKPVGIDHAEAAQILASAKRANRLVFVALNRRSYGSTRLALTEIASDESPRLISVLDQQDIVTAREMGQPEAVTSNYMYANSIHLIDYLRMFGRGRIVDVTVQSAWSVKDPRYVVATVYFESGDIGVYQAVWNGPGPWSVTVTNAKTRVEMRPLERLGVQQRGQRNLTPAADDPADTAFKPGIYHQAQQFLVALAGGPTTLATIEDAVLTMQLCGRIYERD